MAPERLRWVEADLSTWEPGDGFDLVTTHYAHPAMDQLAFYDRIAAWVAPGGTLLIVGHGHTDGGHAHRHEGHSQDGPLEGTMVAAAAITARLDATGWDIATAMEPTRTHSDGGRSVELRDVVVRATRRC